MTKNTKAASTERERLLDAFEAAVFTEQLAARHPEITAMKKNGNGVLSLREAVQAAGSAKVSTEVRRFLAPLVHNAKKVLGYRDDQLEKARDARKKAAKK
jgi:hypothetical protein